MKDKSNNPARRPVECEYLAVMSEVVSLSVWERICQRAAEDAMAGDHKARDWVSKTLTQSAASPLTVLAAQETLSDSMTAADLEIEAKREALQLERRKAAADKEMTDIIRPDCQ